MDGHWTASGLAAALSTALLGCRPAVVVPHTPDAMACVRECMAIYNQCMGDTPDLPFYGLPCKSQRHDCQLTCPGAYEEVPEKKSTDDEERSKPAKRSCDGSCGDD